MSTRNELWVPFFHAGSAPHSKRPIHTHLVQYGVFKSDERLSNTYPHYNVSCQSLNDTHCTIDFDKVTGAKECISHFYEL
jgi:hypothetical protein